MGVNYCVQESIMGSGAGVNKLRGKHPIIAYLKAVGVIYPGVGLNPDN